MRPTLKPTNLLERVALRFNLAPAPVAEAMYSPPVARSIMAGVRLGVFGRLAGGEASADELARDLDLTPEGARLLLDALAAPGYVERSGERWRVTRRARRWLDPESPDYCGHFVEHGYDYWGWWDRLEHVLRTGEAVEIHADDPSDPHWRRYMLGQWELARLSAPEVARALRLPANARRLLDVAGGHGWFSAELCRRHDGLEATVLDLPGSVAVGREIVAGAGMADRVRHVEGDMFESDLGGPYDAALCFNIIHHLSPADCVRLFRRIADALVPGGTLAVLDLFLPRSGSRPDAGAYLALFFHLTSGASTYTPDDLGEWLREAGFESPRRVRIRRIPVQTLYQARRS